MRDKRRTIDRKKERVKGIRNNKLSPTGVEGEGGVLSRERAVVGVNQWWSLNKCEAWGLSCDDNIKFPSTDLSNFNH